VAPPSCPRKRRLPARRRGSCWASGRTAATAMSSRIVRRGLHVTKNDPSFSDYALAEVHVDPKVAAAFAAWLTELAGRAVFVSPRADVPEWVGTAAELLYAWAAEIPWANGQAGTAGQAGTSKSPRAGDLHGGFLAEVLAERVVPAVPPSPPGSPLTMRSLLEQQRAARLAVGVADALAAAVRAGDAERIARCLVAFEQASSTYYAAIGEELGDDGGSAS
jgi:hypothetical protein